MSSDRSAKATVDELLERVFEGRFLLLGVSCGEDFRSNESPAKLSARLETTRRKLKPANWDETPLVAIRTRAPTTTPPNGHSTRSLTAIGLGSGHQAENRIAKLRCAAKLIGLAPASEEGDDYGFYSATLQSFPEVVSNQANKGIQFEWRARGRKIDALKKSENMNPGNFDFTKNQVDPLRRIAS